MAKIFYDKSLNIDTPTIILKKRDFTNIGKIVASEIKYKDNFASANELSFKIYKFIDNNFNTFWEEINDYNIIYVPEYEEFFDMHVSLSEEIGTYKTITCTALAESELSNVKLYDIEINTEADVDREDYDANYPTIFYRDLHGYEVGSETYKKLKGASLLHRILDKASNYEIGHVDASLMSLKSFYEFSISDTNIYDELTGEIAEQYKCLFTFDIDEYGTRTVNAYDLCNTCNICGYRGEFYDECPECHSIDFYGAYGEDTTIFSSKENLATSSTIESNKDQLKNCFRVSGGDDLITATIANLNPNGSNYFYYFSPEMLASMPENLVSKIQSYNAMYDNYLSNKEFVLSTTNVNNYNNVISYIKKHYPDELYSSITTKIIGYKNIATLDYNIIDLLGFLTHSMMPTPDISLDGQTIEDAKNSLTTANLSPVAITNPSSSGAKLLSDNAVLLMAKTLVNTALYKVEIDSSTYTYNSSTKKGTWKGIFKLTSFRDNNDTVKTNNISIVVDDNEERYIQQKIKRTLAKEDDVIRDITNIEMEYNDFLDRLTYYSSSYLEGVYQAFNACLGIIDESDNDNLKTNVRSEYKKRMTAVGEELNVRAGQIVDVTLLSEEIEKIKSDTRNALDFELYLGKDLWRIFCSYRREDNYQNDNFISDGIENDNAELMKLTQQLIDEAKKELYKAGNLQYNISSTLNNLLAIKEFQPLVEDFKCGNWIRVMIDEKIYNLRLLSYEIDYDSLENIGVEFSTVTKVWSGVSDIKSVLDSAQSIAGSYSSTISKVKQSTKSTKYVNDWVDKGFSLTANKIVNNADNQDIVIDKTGILCRSYDDIEGLYDDCQFKIISNGAYFTRNNWETVEAGIGKFHYYDPEEKKEVEDYGVIARTVVGKLFFGENLKIYNESGSLRFDTDGFTVENDTNTFIVNPNETQLVKIQKNGENIFYVDTNGNLNATGTINADSGYLKDLNITGKLLLNGGYLTTSSSRTSYNQKVSGMTLSSSGIGAYKSDAQCWNMTAEGVLTAAGANITGTITTDDITATGGFIGNFTLSNGVLSHTNGNYSIFLKGVQNDKSWGVFYIEDRTSGTKTYPFRVNGDGSFSATKANITGVIKAEEFKYEDSNYLVTVSDGFNIKNKSNYAATSYSITGSDGSMALFHDELCFYSGTDYNGTRASIYLDGDSRLHFNKTIYSEGNMVALGGKYFVEGASGNNVEILQYDKSTKFAEVGVQACEKLTLRGKNVVLAHNDATVTSDERLKNSFKSLDEFDSVFMVLNPVSFKYNNGTSDRFHFGFGASQIRDSFVSNGFTTKDFAGFVQMSASADDEDYGGITDPMGLRYSEFVSWNTHMIQKTINKQNELINEMDILKEENNSLKSQLALQQEQINTILAKLEAVG